MARFLKDDMPWPDPQTWERLMYPQIRRVLMNAMAELADEDFQRTVWPDPPRYPEYGVVGLDRIAGDLDLMSIDDDKSIDAKIGITLFDQGEADKLKEFMHVFSPLVRRLQMAPDEEYTKAPEWPQVVAMARALYEKIKT